MVVDPSQSTIVSHSEVKCEHTCERQHYYRFGLGLQRRENNDARTYGNLGHQALFRYYGALQEGKSWADACKAAIEPLLDKNATAPIEVRLQLYKRLLEYFEAYQHDRYEVVLNERPLLCDLDTSIFGFTADLVVKTSGGSLILYDHKFVSKFWDLDGPKYEAQLVKYSYALRQLGYPIYKAFYNFIKYVDSRDEEYFRRVSVSLYQPRVDTIMQEHERDAGRIIERRRLPIETYRDLATRNLDKDVCKRCDFRLPCEMEMEGQDVSGVLTEMYEPSTYGYFTSPPEAE